MKCSFLVFVLSPWRCMSWSNSMKRCETEASRLKVSHYQTLKVVLCALHYSRKSAVSFLLVSLMSKLFYKNKCKICRRGHLEFKTIPAKPPINKLVAGSIQYLQPVPRFEGSSSSIIWIFLMTFQLMCPLSGRVVSGPDVDISFYKVKGHGMFWVLI